MAWRIIREVLLLLGVTVLILAVVVFAAYAGLSGLDLAVVLATIPEFVVGMAGPALGIWAFLLVVGAVLLRHRGPWPRIGLHMLSAMIAAIGNVVIVSALGDAAGAEGGLVGTLGLFASLIFLPASTVAILLVELALVRPHRIPRAAAPALAS